MGYESYNNKKLNYDLSKKLSQIIENQQSKNNDNTNIMKSLLDINKDIKGAININNTKINYLVVQCENNQFYINHDVKQNKSKYGTIFFDYRNTLGNNFIAGQNIILYGHNMKDGTMFSGLKKFRNEEFFNKKNVIDLHIFPKKYKFEVFSVLIVDADFDYRNIFLKNDQQIGDYLKKIKNSSLYFKNIDLNCKDTILTLSTCSYEKENSRLVVQGKLTRCK